jgi:putative ABC transport system ATP-binding protein
LEIRAGDVCCILGPSGSGKTTLLNLLGGLDLPSEGRVVVDGHELAGLSSRGLTLFRRASVGFVFQFFNLVPSLTARENVQVAGELAGAPRAEADRWLERVGLAASRIGSHRS